MLKFPSILNNCKQYPFVLVTEFRPNPNVKLSPNLDKITWADIRNPSKSAVFLELPPFSVNNIEHVLTVPIEKGESLDTFLVRNP